MINLLFALILIGLVIWSAKKLYFPTEIAQDPKKYPAKPGVKVSQKDLAVVLSNLQRWKSEGKITREEYDHLTDLCLSEMQGPSRTAEKE